MSRVLHPRQFIRCKSVANVLFPLFLLTALGACGSSEPDVMPTKVNEALVWLQNKGQLPTLDVSTTPEGPDQDGNGVRDDIDTIIKSMPENASQKSHILSLAKSLRQSLTVDPKDQASMDALSVNIARSIGCIYELYDLDTARIRVRMVRNYTVNTIDRFRAFQKFNVAMHSSVTTLPATGACNV